MRRMMLGERRFAGVGEQLGETIEAELHVVRADRLGDAVAVEAEQIAGLDRRPLGAAAHARQQPQRQAARPDLLDPAAARARGSPGLCPALR